MEGSAKCNRREALSTAVMADTAYIETKQHSYLYDN